MRNFTAQIDIAAPPARVWAVMRDVERWQEWTASITAIQRLDEGPLHVGSRARVRQPWLLPAVFTVTHLTEDRGFTWVTRSLGMQATGGHWITPIEDGSRAALSLRFDGPLGGVSGWLARGLIQRYLGLEADGLKRRSEQAQPQPAVTR
jgi:carbon monoxide dehydrogenase subunit G